MFKDFPKIARLSRDVVVSEKLDGTNSSVIIDFLSNRPEDIEFVIARDPNDFGTVMLAGSRNRFVVPGDDNYGFAAWVKANSEALFGLGLGEHFGEYWGAGIQRKYGLKEKHFSLFNVARWADDRDKTKYPQDRPSCCDVVPVLYRGPFNTAAIDSVLDNLRAAGSVAAPGFFPAEGIVVWHEAARQLFKKTVKDDEKPKGLVG